MKKFTVIAVVLLLVLSLYGATKLGPIETKALTINGDTTFTAAPRITWSGYIGAPGVSTIFSIMTPDKPITVTRVQAYGVVAATGCSGQGSIVLQGSGDIGAIVINTANVANSFDSGAVSQNYAAANQLQMSYNLGSGCSQQAAQIHMTVQYKMQ